MAQKTTILDSEAGQSRKNYLLRFVEFKRLTAAAWRGQSLVDMNSFSEREQ